MARPALFLDRDGVINIDHGYVYRKEEFEFVDGIFDLVSKAHNAGYLVIVVTNQAGIGRGYYTEADFHELMNWVCDEFKRHGGQIDAVYFCPDHPEHGIGAYRRESHYRKPGPGMLLQAASDFDIDMDRSIMIGDKPSDMVAARTAGVGRLLELVRPDETSDYVAITGFREALRFIEGVGLEP
ncbi:MAG: HAD family hydrolase [Chlorobiaceae bacterium]|nr:HAD family hydrolase [Chlorobiaceae bacterium]